MFVTQWNQLDKYYKNISNNNIRIDRIDNKILII